MAVLHRFTSMAACIIFLLTLIPHLASAKRLKFKADGEFKILQVADMHYANGKTTECENVFPEQMKYCSDLNTTAFLNRMIEAENPDFIVFTGDNIYGANCDNKKKSLNMAFAPAVESGIPWAAVLGNHDEEGFNLDRKGVMEHIVGMKNSLSKMNPKDVDGIDGFGNYNLEVYGAEGSAFSTKSVLNLYMLDSGDYSTVDSIPNSYGWIKASQSYWFNRTSTKLQKKYMRPPNPQSSPAPGLAYFHIPLPEFTLFDSANMTGVKTDTGKYGGISCPDVNSGFFTTLEEAGDVKAVFIGHDHLNDFCAKLNGIQLCYAGGFGYHAYGRAGFPRRARVMVANLEKTKAGKWGGVNSIKTWKRLDDEKLSTIDTEVLWTKESQ